MTSRFQTAAILLTAAAMAACASTEPHNLGTLQVLNAADRNGDEAVDLTEWVTEADQTYSWLDRDLNDKVSVEDVEQGFDAFDLNDDGVLTQTELASAEMDADGDGVITREEWDGALVHSAMDLNEDGNVSRSEARVYSSRGHRSWDRDGDGRVSRAEAADSEQFTLWRF